MAGPGGFGRFGLPCSGMPPYARSSWCTYDTYLVRELHAFFRRKQVLRAVGVPREISLCNRRVNFRSMIGGLRHSLVTAVVVRLLPGIGAR